MRDPVTKHAQGFVTAKESDAVDAYVKATLSANSKSSAVRELIVFALLELGWLEECNGNITAESIRQMNSNKNKPKTTKTK